MTRPHIEYLVAAIIVVIIAAMLLPAVIRARASIRDDLRLADIANLKHAAEMYYNQHNFYPALPGSESTCTASHEPDSWLFGENSPLLKEGHINAIPHDVREIQGHVYTYCATQAKGNQGLGFFFQTELEVDQPDNISFDAEEGRNFNYRILHENGKMFYRVCGGTETQCTPQAS